MKLPEGHHRVTPYLILENAAAFFDFTRQAFEASETKRMYKDGTKELKYGEIAIGDSAIMFGQATDQWGVANASLFIYVEDADETFKKALEAGATEVLPLSDQDYGRSGGVKDPFGNTWWITKP